MASKSTKNDSAPTTVTDTDGAGMNEPRRSSDPTDLVQHPDAATAAVGHKDETYYNANPPASPSNAPDGEHDTALRDMAGKPPSPQASPSAIPDYTRNSGAKTATVTATSDDQPRDKSKDLPTQEDWESLGVGSTLEKTENGWLVTKRVTAGGGFVSAEGPSITRAFQLLGAQYEVGEDNRRTLVDVNGTPIPPEAD